MDMPIKQGMAQLDRSFIPVNFPGGHCIPAKIATQALSWLVEEAPPK